MGLLDLFGKDCVCPLCRWKGARKTLGKVKCRNGNCANFDLDHSRTSEASAEVLNARPVDTSHLRGEFDPGEYRVEVRYRNAQGEERIYAGDARSVCSVGEHLSMRLIPTGHYVAFAKKWVANLDDVFRAASLDPNEPKPSSEERRVLRFHKRKGSTSALYQRLREKYPHFR